MKYCVIIIFSFFIPVVALAQLSIGPGYGRGRIMPGELRSKAPSLMINYYFDDGESEAFLDFSYYKFSRDWGSTQIVDDFGNTIGYADTKQVYTLPYIQLGWERAIGGDFDRTKATGFIGAGVALAFEKFTTKYELPGHQISDDKFKQFVAGFHFNLGAQYRLKPVIFELKGCFDIVLKTLTQGGLDDNTNLFSCFRFGVLIPVIKPQHRYAKG